MSDLIDRQTVLDRAVVVPMFGKDVKMVAVSEIVNLPSAQPELPEWAQVVERWYKKALCLPYIKKPLAWALYQAWKEYDNE